MPPKSRRKQHLRHHATPFIIMGALVTSMAFVGVTACTADHNAKPAAPTHAVIA